MRIESVLYNYKCSRSAPDINILFGNFICLLFLFLLCLWMLIVWLLKRIIRNNLHCDIVFWA